MTGDNHWRAADDVVRERARRYHSEARDWREAVAHKAMGRAKTATGAKADGETDAQYITRLKAALGITDDEEAGRNG